MLPIIHINTERDGAYKNVSISFKNESSVFNTGDVCKDYLDCIIFAEKTFHPLGIMLSSDVDHWCFDNDNYGWDIVEIDGKEYETIVKL